MKPTRPCHWRSAMKPTRKELTTEEQTAALVTYLLAALLWKTPHGEDNDDSWFEFCVKNMVPLQETDPFGTCVWWALRHEANATAASGDDFLGYLTHVCRNGGFLAR